MDIRLFDLNLLRALDALLQERNVTRAAERLFVTQQAASGALQRLRKHFGDELLTRVGRHLEPTPLARSLVAPVREALIAAQSALNTNPMFDPSQATLTCRIAMTDYSILVLLPRVLRLLTTQAPQMHCLVEPVTHDSFERLDMGDLDFCLTAHDASLYGSHRPGKRLLFEAMFDDDFVCVVDPECVDVSNGISLATYLTSRHNTVDFGQGVATIVERAWAASQHDFSVAVTVPSFSAQIFMLRGTPLIATAQRRLADALAPRLGLSVAECPMRLPRLDESLRWHERNDRDPAHRFLRGVFKTAAAQLDLLPD